MCTDTSKGNALLGCLVMATGSQKIHTGRQVMCFRACSSVSAVPAPELTASIDPNVLNFVVFPPFPRPTTSSVQTPLPPFCISLPPYPPPLLFCSSIFCQPLGSHLWMQWCLHTSVLSCSNLFPATTHSGSIWCHTRTCCDTAD